MKKEIDLVVLTGHRKSGTTVFSKLFDGHPDLFIYPTDIAVLYAYFPFYTSRSSENEEELRERLSMVLEKSLTSIAIDYNLSDVLIQNFIHDVNATLTFEGLKHRLSVIRSIATSWIKNYYQSKESKPFLFKETSQSIYLGSLLSEDDSIKMISIVRDPRDNFAALKSGVKKYYSRLGEDEKDTLASLINRARLDLISAKNNATEYPSNFKAVKFEELVANTDSIMQSLADFIGISFTTDMRVPTLGGRKSYAGNNFDGLKFKGIDGKNIGQWKQRISKEEAQIIEFFLYDVMAFWGYPLEYPVETLNDSTAEYYSWFNSKYFFKDSFA